MICLSEEFPVVPNGLPARQLHVLLPLGQVIASVGRATDIAHILHAGAASKIIRDFHNLLFAHAVDQKVRATAFQNGGQQLIFPIIEMYKAAQTGLDAADNHRQLRP